MFGVGVVAEVLWLPQRAARLAQHLEPFTIKFCRRRQRKRQIKEQGLFDSDGFFALIDELRATERTVPFSCQLHLLDAGRVTDWHPRAWRINERLSVEAFYFSVPH